MPRKAQKGKEVKFTEADEMQPHSEAKVALYRTYIEKYLAILSVAKFITQINIFDVFCGTGIYKNGKSGSPVAAYQAIIRTRKLMGDMNRPFKPIALIVNDGNPQSVSKVSAHLSALNAKESCCSLEFHNLDAKGMFTRTIDSLKTQDSSVRSLVFIDPTGYKDIHLENLNTLLKYKTEVILFLPVSFMYRFKGAVQKDYDNPSYVHLRRFIQEFFDEHHPIRKGDSMGVFQFINYLVEAFKFNGTYYSTSFFLQRNKANFYALFFITSNILGLERIIDTKWELDPYAGSGFVYEDIGYSQQLPLFADDKSTASGAKMRELEEFVEGMIQNNADCNNLMLYSWVLLKDFRIPQALQILIKWQESGRLLVWDVEKNKEARKKSFYLNYDYYKTNQIKATFKLI